MVTARLYDAYLTAGRCRVATPSGGGVGAARAASVGTADRDLIARAKANVPRLLGAAVGLSGGCPSQAPVMMATAAAGSAAGAEPSRGHRVSYARVAEGVEGYAVAAPRAAFLSIRIERSVSVPVVLMRSTAGNLA
ncbi:hypothetical protein MMPV_008488 [Pyropia vietnamensis]